MPAALMSTGCFLSVAGVDWLTLACCVYVCLHLPTIQVVGMLSIKDLIKEIQKEKDDIITKLSDFNIGKGAFFQHGASAC